MAEGRTRRKQARSLVEFLARPSLPLPALIDTGTAARQVTALHRAHGGCTFNLRYGSLAAQPLFAVSLYPDRGIVVAGREVDAETVALFIEANLDLLFDPRNSVGTWYNEADGHTYIDVSATLSDADQAMDLARQYNQIAIFDLGALVELDAGGSGEELEHLPPPDKRLPALRRVSRRRGADANE